jgi:hypothetical protein
LKLKETKRHSKYHKRGHSTHNLAAPAGSQLLKVENDSSEALNQTVQLEAQKLPNTNSEEQTMPATEQLGSYGEQT